jgi:serine/threonine protein kinase
MADNPLQVGHYKLLKTLGIGAFGKVKLGKHVVTGHYVRSMQSLSPPLPLSLPLLSFISPTKS